MIGPCLCGDPYCPSCGNPSQAAFEDMIGDFLDKLYEDLSELVETEGDLEVFKEAGMATLKAHKKVEKEVRDDEARYWKEKVDSLQNEIRELKSVIKLGR